MAMGLVKPFICSSEFLRLGTCATAHANRLALGISETYEPAGDLPADGFSWEGFLDIASKMRELEHHRDATWAWRHYLDTVRDLIGVMEQPSVIEVGGGRSPSFSREEVEGMRITYTSNDISARELALAPEWVNKAHFDVQTADESVISPYREQYDLAFSKMVMEHVPNYRRAYRNLHAILRDGGISIAFHPVLFSVPFVLNRVLPEGLSTRLLQSVFPNRTEAEIPKFPAVYSGCRITSGVRTALREIGFRKVWQVPFYGHGYYAKFPGLREAHRRLSEVIAASNIRLWATYAYTIVQK